MVDVIEILQTFFGIVFRNVNVRGRCVCKFSLFVKYFYFTLDAGKNVAKDLMSLSLFISVLCNYSDSISSKIIS